MLSYHLNGDIDVSSRNMNFIEHSVEWILAHFHVGAGMKIADFGCGPGLYTSRLAGYKADVTGIDFSARSIRYARKTAAEGNLDIEYIHQNYLEFETAARFDLVLRIICNFCAISPAQRKTMLGKFYDILAPDGSVLLDVYSHHAFDEREETAVYEANQLNGFWSPDKYYGFVNSFKYEDEKVVLDKYTIVAKDQTRTVYNWLQYFDPDRLKNELEESGLFVKEVYADVAGSPYNKESREFAIVAKKNKDRQDYERFEQPE